MANNNLTVEIAANMRVSDETVNRCLKLIQWWLNDNPDKKIEGGIRKPNGKSGKIADRNAKGIYHIERGDRVMTEAEQTMTINGLRVFTRGWCLDRAKTDESGELVHRCSECPFSDGTFCKIKRFVHDQFGAEAAYSISAMRR